MSLIVPDLYLASQNEASHFITNASTDIVINAAFEVSFPLIRNTTILNLNWYDEPQQEINKNDTLFRVIDVIDSYLMHNQRVVVNCFEELASSRI
jgi:hypothetical protein